MTDKKILLVEHDPAIVRAVAQTLAEQGYRTVEVCSGHEAVASILEERPDMIVLDLDLPDPDGYEVVRAIRDRSEVPIIVLSARGEEAHRLLAFRLGVDDYITKPFSPLELCLRVRAVLRRASGLNRDEASLLPGVDFGDVAIDRLAREVRVRGRPVHLTAREFDLLWLLASRPSQVLARDRLAREL